MKYSNERKYEKVQQVDLSTQQGFVTLQGRCWPHGQHWSLTSTGAEQILASWAALSSVIYPHPAELLSSPHPTHLQVDWELTYTLCTVWYGPAVGLELLDFNIM